MVRYTVTIVGDASIRAGTTLAIPFEPTVIVSAFIDELFKRIERQGIQLAPNSHITLHLDGETGAIIDAEDILGDVVDTNDKLFAVFERKCSDSVAAQSSLSAMQLASEDDGPQLRIRIITPSLAKKSINDIQPISICTSATVASLREKVSKHLGLSDLLEQQGIENECNCALARKLATASPSSEHFIVIYGKSSTRKLELPSVITKKTLTDTLKNSFGEDSLNSKKVYFHGGELSGSTAFADDDEDEDAVETAVSKPPVMCICSKERHIPAMAKAQVENYQGPLKRTLDLHTSEFPITQACSDMTLAELGLDGLANDGIIDIFAVNRATTISGGSHIPGVGKQVVFRNHAHWSPAIQQSDRGMAMFLSSLRVFTSAVQEMDADDRAKDAIYHIFDLLIRPAHGILGAGFPPALRTLRRLFEGATLNNAMEAAALSCVIFQIVDDWMPKEIIGGDQGRLFEFSRLLFGFILEKARSVKLPETDNSSMPYLSSFEELGIRDAQTREPIFHMVFTDIGKLEKPLFEALELGDVKLDNQSPPTRIEDETRIKRIALLSGGTAADVLVLSAASLANNYQYPDGGFAHSVFDLTELRELHHLAELSGRHKLAVHRPSNLASSAIAPCLTYDRLAHVSVYTGQLPCSEPGKSSEIFRPARSPPEETIDEAVVEQLIAPTLAGYEADGTAVFCLLGGSTVRRMQGCDEILMVAVDVSGSMSRATDFADVNEEVITPSAPTAAEIVEPEYYNRTSFDDLKQTLLNHESFEDMIGIVAEASRPRQRRRALQKIDLMRIMLSAKIVKQQSDLEAFQQRFRNYRTQRMTELESTLNDLKAFWAALQTHQTDVADFMIFWANTNAIDLGKRWKWYPGENLPAGSSAGYLPALPATITECPDEFMCPISHALMEDAVSAVDAFTYSRQAIREWFRVKDPALSSPMTGLAIQSSALESNDAVSSAVADWIRGQDLIEGTPRSRSRFGLGDRSIQLRFHSRMGRFSRDVRPAMTMNDVYKLVFRGLKARFMVFQLTINDETILPGNETLASKNIRSGTEVHIRLADDTDMRISTTGTASASTRTGEMCLIKVYQGTRMEFSYWVNRETTKTLESVIWKYWRNKFTGDQCPALQNYTVWSDLKTTGDGMLVGDSREVSEVLSSLLNREHCHGILADEPKYDKEGDGAGSTDPLVLKVDIAKPWSQTSKARDAKLSRLDVLKQMFEAIINRMLAYSYKTHLGLVTFANEARVATPITHILENFRRANSTMSADGDTALWDAIALCKDQIDQYAKDKFPNAKKRIIVISDGANTKTSTHTAAELAWRLSQDNVVVDTVILGHEANEDLKAISHHLGGYKFSPTTLPNALLTCELEPFLSLKERPPIIPPSGTPRSRLPFLSNFWTAWYSAGPTVVTTDHFPPRKTHANLNDTFIPLSAASSRPARTPAAGNTRSNLRITRLMNEMRNIVANIDNNPNYDVYVSESDITFWKVVMAGPSGSPYEGGSFLLYIHAGEDYPTFAPDARFVTKTRHPNVNAHGRICHALLSRDWTSDTSMSTILDTVFALLFQADTSDSVDTAATLGYHHDQVEYADEVREYVRKHARKSREDWKNELLGWEDEE